METKQMSKRQATVGQGWWPIVDKARLEIENAGVELEVFECKEKYGELRILARATGEYAYTRDSAVMQAVERARSRSAETCETCGGAGQLMGPGPWRTRCKEHSETA